MSLSTAMFELKGELEKWNVHHAVFASALHIGQRGKPVVSQRAAAIVDPGVAVQFEYGGQPLTFNCDRYNDTRSNTRSIGLTLKALRDIRRHGAHQIVERMFTGLRALPAPDDDPYTVLGIARNASAQQIDKAYKDLAMRLHPDRGGNPAAFAKLANAKAELDKLHG